MEFSAIFVPTTHTYIYIYWFGNSNSIPSNSIYTIHKRTRATASVAAIHRSAHIATTEFETEMGYTFEHVLAPIEIEDACNFLLFCIFFIYIYNFFGA